MNPQVGGAAPKAPGIYRIPARMTERGGRSLGLRSFRLLSRRSGCVPAVPYSPLRSFQSGLLQPRRAMIYQPTAITPLTLCLTPGVQFKVRITEGELPDAVQSLDHWLGNYRRQVTVEGDTSMYGIVNQTRWLRRYFSCRSPAAPKIFHESPEVVALFVLLSR